MPFELVSFSVAELVRSGELFVEDGNHGENRPLAHEFSETGTPFIRPDNLANGELRFEGCDRINEVAARRVRKGKGKAGDILFTHRATVGRIARVGPTAPDFVANPGVTVWRVSDGRRIDRDYLYYYMQSSAFMDQVWSMAGGTDTFPYISLTQQRTLLLELAPVAEQRAIGSVLGTLDDRISLLRQTNATLESIAQALFKSWFIDFDPVRAKAEGREPEGMDAATAALFPAEFEESALGLIPKGWTAGSVYEVASIVYGAPFASKLFNTDGNGQPLVRIRDLRDEAPAVWTPEVHPKGYLIRPGDIVVGMDGEFRAYLWGGESAWLNQRVCCFHPIAPHGAAFVRCSIAAPLAHIEATEVATTVIHLGKGDIDRFKVVVPTPAVAKAFSELTAPLYARIVANKAQGRNLAAARDTLLPRLISGKLRLPEARAQLEEVLA